MLKNQQPTITRWVSEQGISDDSAAGYLLKHFLNFNEAAFEVYPGLQPFKKLILDCESQEWNGAFKLQNKLFGFLMDKMPYQGVCLKNL